MAVQEPVVDRAVEQVEYDFDFGVLGDLAAFDRALEDRAGLLAAGLDKACAVFLGELRIRLRLGEQRGDHAPVRAPVGEPYPGAQEAAQVAAERSGVAGRRDVCPFVIERVRREGLLGGPPAVDRGLADAGPSGDGIHAHGGQAAFKEEFRRRVEDCLPRLLAARPSALGDGLRLVRVHARLPLVLASARRRGSDLPDPGGVSRPCGRGPRRGRRCRGARIPAVPPWSAWCR